MHCHPGPRTVSCRVGLLVDHVRRRAVPDDGDADGPDGVRQLPPAQYQTDGLRGVRPAPSLMMRSPDGADGLLRPAG